MLVGSAIVVSDAHEPFVSSNLNVSFRREAFNDDTRVMWSACESLLDRANELSVSKTMMAKVMMEYLKFIAKTFADGLNHAERSRALDDEHEKIKEIVFFSRKNYDIDSYGQLLKKNYKKLHASLVTEAFKLAGLTGKIFIEEHDVETPTIELKDGNLFRVKIPNSFFHEKREWNEKNVKIMIVDGAIERVSVIHSLLDSLALSREPTVVVCRKFGEDVISTLVVNRARGTLNVIPVTMSSDLDDVNQHADIATACNSDVISSLKGEFPSHVSANSLKKVDNVVCTPASMIVSDVSGARSSAIVAQRLSEELSYAGDVRRKIVFNRLASLSSRRVIIRFPRSQKHQSDLSHEEILACVREMKNMISRSVIGTPSLSMTALASAFDDQKFVACSDVLVSVDMVCSVLKQLSSIGVIVSIDRESRFNSV